MTAALEIITNDRSYIRKFKSADIETLWRECRRGRLDLSKKTGYGAFLEYVTFLINKHQSHWVVVDRGKFIGIMFVKTDGWTIEPHAEFFNDITPAAIFRSYMQFFDEIDNMEGTYIIKSDKKTKNLFDRLTKKGYTQFVGEIPNGNPTGDLYVYCKKQTRRLT